MKDYNLRNDKIHIGSTKKGQQKYLYKKGDGEEGDDKRKKNTN